MENQHRKIKGYRELSQEEIDLMNRIKEHGEKTKALIDELYQLRNKEEEAEIFDPEQKYESRRCLRIAREHLQTGQMWFVRAVALPESF